MNFALLAINQHNTSYSLPECLEWGETFVNVNGDELLIIFSFYDQLLNITSFSEGVHYIDSYSAFIILPASDATIYCQYGPLLKIHHLGGDDITLVHCREFINTQHQGN